MEFPATANLKASSELCSEGPGADAVVGLLAIFPVGGESDTEVFPRLGF